METVRTERVLKRDVLGRVELLVRGDERRVRRVACGSRWPLSRAIARVLAARERRALERLAGSDAVPRLETDPAWRAASSADGSLPKDADVLVRGFVEGVALSQAEALPCNYFERLAAEVRELHARGVCHNDLHKEQNVLVRPDGRPAVVDFQLASVHRVGSLVWRARVAEDLRHVEKHRRRYMRTGRGPAGAEIDVEQVPRPKRRALAWTWRRLGKPLYHFVTRKLLRTRDGAEERRPSSGPWPRWTEPLA
ncbi:MAG: phosphotransferase [Planctomycetes bacterium]|nr:phosphotransferase [Planctomycetota bacterium]